MESLYRQIVPGADDRLQRLFQSWQRGRRPRSVRLVFHVDGSAAIECRVGVLCVATGSVPSYVALRLSPVNRADAAWRHQAGWPRAVLSRVSDGILLTNASGQVTFMNPVAEELTAWKEAEAAGQPLQLVLPVPNDAEGPVLLTSRSGRERLITKRTAGGRGEAGITVIRDVADQVRAQDELRQATDSLHQFTYLASHDLQEPLRMVAIYSQLLARKLRPEVADDEVSEYLGYTLQGARRMEALVRDLVAYTEAGVDGPFERVDCKAALEAALANIRPELEESGAQIITGSLPVLWLHQPHIVQLFQHLISNAAGYRGAEPPRIRISAVRSDSEWEFSVSDNGLGIPPQYHSYVFGIFKRLHPGSASVGTGTGIGLAICKRIVERYKGRIWLESEPGRGATFYFTLPGVVK